MLYETDHNRWRQLVVADTYARAHGLGLQLKPRTHPWDVEFSKDSRLVILAEIKSRSCARLDFATFKVDKAKVDTMLEAAKRRRVKCGLLVEFTDGQFKLLMTAEWLAEHARESVIHRKDREGEAPDPAWEWSNQLWRPLVERR